MVIGLTGVPGAGKSLAASFFAEKGAYIISGDDLGREVLDLFPGVLRKIKKTFGKSVFNIDGSLDRKKMGRLVFKDPKAMKKLNTIIHPPLLRLMKSKIKSRSERKPNDMVIVDAALIYEWGIEGWFEQMIVVRSTRENRLKRLKLSGLSRKEAADRIASQIPQRTKAARADYVISNDGTKAALRKKIYRLYAELGEARG